jgi:hypothetical protein
MENLKKKKLKKCLVTFEFSNVTKSKSLLYIFLLCNLFFIFYFLFFKNQMVTFEEFKRYQKGNV